MHEMGLARGILAVVNDIAGDQPVERIAVHLGALHAVVGDSLAFNFQLLAEGTVMEGAELVVEPTPGDEVRVDEVVLAGSPPRVIRRPGADVGEAPHDAAEHHQHPAWR